MIPGSIRRCAPPGGGRGGCANGHDLRKVGEAGRAGGSGRIARRRPGASRQRRAGRLRPVPGAVRQGRATGATGAKNIEADCRA